MPIYGPWASKPSPGTPLDRARGLAQGLVFFAPLWEGAGPSVSDAVTSGYLSLPVTAATWGSGSMLGLSCASSTARAQVATPDWLKLPGPCTIAVAMQPFGLPAGNCSYFGTTYTTASTSPFYGVTIGSASATLTPKLFYNSSGGPTSIASSAAMTAGQDAVVSASLQPNSQSLYLGGQPVGTSVATGSILYSSSLLAFGAVTSFARNPNALFYWGALWNRTLSAAEHAAIGASPAAIFGLLHGTPRHRWLMNAAAVATAKAPYGLLFRGSNAHMTGL